MGEMYLISKVGSKGKLQLTPCPTSDIYVLERQTKQSESGMCRMSSITPGAGPLTNQCFHTNHIEKPYSKWDLAIQILDLHVQILDLELQILDSDIRIQNFGDQIWNLDGQIWIWASKSKI